jgi:DNA-binding winged helix-turn-helix (wHTH) protein/tetratricopeptide (TPR) repeat protein
VAAKPRIHFPPFALDPVNECLWSGSSAIKLRPKAFAVLAHLLSQAGQLVTKEQLIGAVWQDTFVGDAVLKVAIRQIREALSDDPKSPRFIETSHRRGYRFIGQISADTDTVSPSPQSAAVGFVGREHALAQMHTWLNKARGGDCQVVFVTGEAGIGKTTLVETFVQSVASDPTVRICHGQCLEQYGMSEAYLPVLDAIRQLCLDDAQVADVLRTQAPMWLMQMPSLVTPADREHFGREVLGATRERMLREMGQALDALTSHSALVLVLEDLHWSDLSTLDLISYVARRRRAAHLMVVGTYRPAELIASRHPLKAVKQELFARGECEELPLEYLTRDAVRQHIAARFPVNTFPEDLVAVIHERTEGNPLFMVNTIEHLIAERFIESQDGRWRLTVPITRVKVGVPESIRQLIEAQLDRLDERDQRTLEAASVAGYEFPVIAVSAALEEDAGGIESRCEELSRRHQFIKESGAQVLPSGQASGRFAFVHAVYRQVLYNRLSTSRRMLLHRRVALRGEEAYGPRVIEIAAELAMHFEQAGDHERAVRYLQQAAVNAMHRSAYREAIAVSRRGLALLGTLPDSEERTRQELRLQIALGVPLIATEGYAAPEVGSVYVRAHELCNRLGTTPEISQVFWGLWTFQIMKGDLATALDTATELLQRPERISYPGVATRGHWAMEVTSTHQGNFRLALEHFDKMLSLYDPEQDDVGPFIEALNPGVAVRCFAGWCHWFVGEPDRAVVRLQEAVTLARRLSEPHGLAHALLFAAVLHQLRGERPMAQHYAEAALDLAAEHGLLLYSAMGQIVRGWALIGSDSDQRAADEVRQGLATWQSTGATLMLPQFMTLLAEAIPPASHNNDEDPGLGLLDDALALVQATGERMYEAEVCRLRGERLLRGAPDEAGLRAAEACFTQALAIARRQDALSLELRAAMSLARLRGRTRDELARDVILPVYQRFTEGFDTPDLLDARQLLDRDAER